MAFAGGMIDQLTGIACILMEPCGMRCMHSSPDIKLRRVEAQYVHGFFFNVGLLCGLSLLVCFLLWYPALMAPSLSSKLPTSKSRRRQRPARPILPALQLPHT